MSARTKIILILAILAAAGIAGVLYYRKARGSNAYRQMKSLIAQYIPGGVPQWLDTGISPVAYYLIDGKATDASRLLAAMDSQYFGYGYEYKSGPAQKGTPYKGEELELHTALHKILQAEQAAQ